MMWLMLQQSQPEDFVIASGEQHTVREFVDRAASELGIFIDWRGTDVNEIGTERASGKVIVRVDPRYFRPTEVDTLLGDPAKAREKLGWVPKTSFDALVREMASCDLREAQRDAMNEQNGFPTFRHHE
jgi:GDPmannose 4,6-dehydratase